MTDKTILEQGGPEVDTSQPHHTIILTETGGSVCRDLTLPVNGPTKVMRMNGEEDADPFDSAMGKHIREDLADEPALLDLHTTMRQPAYWDPKHPDHLMVKSKVMRAFRDGIEE